MAELYLRVSDDIVARLASEASERGVTAADIAAEVLGTHDRNVTWPTGSEWVELHRTCTSEGGVLRALGKLTPVEFELAFARQPAVAA